MFRYFAEITSVFPNLQFFIILIIREVSPELSKDMASFPFSPRPLSPRASSDNNGSASNQKLRDSVVQSLVQPPPRVFNSATGEVANQKVDAVHLMRNSGVQPSLQLPDLLPNFRTSSSSSAPFSASTPGPPGQRKIPEDWTPASDALPSELKMENKLGLQNKECESKTLGSHMAIFPVPLPCSTVS